MGGGCALISRSPHRSEFAFCIILKRTLQNERNYWHFQMTQKYFETGHVAAFSEPASLSDFKKVNKKVSHIEWWPVVQNVSCNFPLLSDYLSLLLCTGDSHEQTALTA
jgi:hypothetical protein